MAYTFLEPDNLKDFIHDSDSYMKPFFEPLSENERISRGQPGRVPKGKPRVTDGTIAGVTRETPKQVIQQLPTGQVIVKKMPEIETYVNAILSDEILLNANSGGTPYSKSKKAIKDTIKYGASAAYCFYNRRGDNFFADFRRIYIKDIGLEKGKVSEFDSNAMKFTGWYTKMDLKAIIWQQQQLERAARERGEKFYGEWDLAALAELIATGEQEKDGENKTESEKQAGEGNVGFYKIEHCMQIGVGAKFYGYSPKLQKVVKTCTNKDPRGTIPLHFLVPEEDDSNPLGEALLAISAGKQNLLDFDMQMYQYSQGLQYSPPVKKWGNVPTSAIKLVPDAVIDMGSRKEQGTDIEVVDIANRAQSNFANNYGLIKSQILNEMGRTGDTSISSTVGNPGFSKTSQGVKQLQERLGVSDNDLRKSYEGWFGRVCETLLNIHFAESQGMKELNLQVETIKKLKLQRGDTATFNYDQDLGPIKFTVDASSSKASDDEKQNETLITLLDTTSRYTPLPRDKQMQIENRIIETSGVDDPEKLTYSDEEIAQAKAEDEAQRQLANQQMVDASQPQEAQPGENVTEDQPMEMEEQPATESQELNEDELQTIQMLQERGYSDDQIATAVIMLREGYSDDDIVSVLQGQQEGVEV